MADVKISNLPASTTPLAGSEVLPIVQGGATKKVSVDNLTAGKAVSALSVTATNLKTSSTTAYLDISGTTAAAAGTDANIDVNINAKGSGVAYLNQRWGVNQSGALVASAGNTYDIGNGTNNPRDVNIDRYAVMNGLTASAAVATNASKQLVSVTNTGTGDNVLASAPTVTNPTVTNYTESVVAIGTVGASHTISLTSGTVQTATLTASTATTFTMPTATAGKSFIMLLKQAAATGNGTATFTGVKWNAAGAPTITATAGKMDILSFVADGTNWYGSINQGFTP